MDKRVIHFDGWSVSFDSGEITRDGSTHRLQDQPLQILEELVSHPGDLVSREQLIARLWPTGVVEFDTGLNSAMRKLRIALGDDAETPRYIETLPRKGYRFIGRIEEQAPQAMNTGDVPTLPTHYVPTQFETGLGLSRRSSDRRAPYKRLALGFGSILVAAILSVVVWKMPGKLFQVGEARESLPTIVVLPLVDMSVDQSEQALCDGLTEELSNWLANIPTLRVVARTSAFAFKDQPQDVRTIARKLGATHVLEGSLRRSGDQLRITVQLIAAETGLHIWSKPYDFRIGDIFEIEETVSRSVAEAMHLTLSKETSELWAQREPEKMEVLEFYLLGRARQSRRTAEDNAKSIQYFRRAVEADPQYIPALTGLAESLLNGLSLNHAPLEDVKAEVEPLIDRAMQINSNLAEVLAVKGWLRTEEFRFDEAMPLLQRATKLNPNDAASHRFLGNLFDRRAQPGEALKHYSASARLDPMDNMPHVFRCMELVDLGDYAEATAACARARELAPTHIWGLMTTGWIARAQGKTDEAIRWLDEARRLQPQDTYLAEQKIDLLLNQGKPAAARTVLRELPDDSGFFALSRESSIVYVEGGRDAVKAWLAEHQMVSKAGTGAELAELARLQLMGGDAVAARATLAHAERILPLSTADMFDGSQIRFEYSAALIRAAIEINGGGDRAKAMKVLDNLDRLLDTYEKNGGDHYGLYVLRAESFALRGQMREAQDAIDTAWKKGWRMTWRLRQEPSMAGLKFPK
ncbi:MAG TPA: tetratricopeptide repeat protein [Steroidobacteraceae bacterium]|jgi:TolB-like protein/DNA-binding winged helix-turn-helix (wHTH) protein/Tfp pilus assembly protein PilF|nr:tetratricopeptide repeat protein [Steroidobacteraceae bacterium]